VDSVRLRWHRKAPSPNSSVHPSMSSGRTLYSHPIVCWSSNLPSPCIQCPPMRQTHDASRWRIHDTYSSTSVDSRQTATRTLSEVQLSRWYPEVSSYINIPIRCADYVARRRTGSSVVFRLWSVTHETTRQAPTAVDSCLHQRYAVRRPPELTRL
jgi:hypothetical protein